MSLIEALIIGLLQGLTEFLPISSSAHLKLAKLFFHIQGAETEVAFDLVCHLGTLFALLYFLRRDILHILRSDRTKLLLIFIAMLPLIPCYFLLKPLREYASQPHYVGLCLILTAAILFLGHRWRLRREPSTTLKRSVKDVLWIGAMQSTALIPGISRSASTISTAKVLGWEPKEAVRFSFLLSIPTIVGGNCLELLRMYISHHTAPILPFSTYIAGFIASFGCGLLIIRFALSYLERGNLKPFAWYCLSFGIIVTLYLNFSTRGG